MLPAINSLHAVTLWRIIKYSTQSQLTFLMVFLALWRVANQVRRSKAETSCNRTQLLDGVLPFSKRGTHHVHLFTKYIFLMGGWVLGGLVGGRVMPRKATWPAAVPDYQRWLIARPIRSNKEKVINYRGVCTFHVWDIRLYCTGTSWKTKKIDLFS